MFATFAVVSLFGVTGGAQASLIGLNNTGAAGSGTDFNYTNNVTGNSATYFNPGYIADSASSKWISTTSGGGIGTATVDFFTSFSVTGSALNISGLWGVDNAATMFLDGVQVAILTGYTVANFDILHPFSFTAGLGNHTLEFAVLNDTIWLPRALLMGRLRCASTLSLPLRLSRRLQPGR